MGDHFSEQAAWPSIDDAAAEALLTGREVAPDLEPVAAVVGALKDAATRPTPPRPDLAARMASGDFARPRFRLPLVGAGRRRQSDRSAPLHVVSTTDDLDAQTRLAARAASVGLALALLGAGTAGFAGALPQSAQDRFEHVVESVIPFELPKRQVGSCGLEREAVGDDGSAGDATAATTGGAAGGAGAGGPGRTGPDQATDSTGTAGRGSGTGGPPGGDDGMAVGAQTGSPPPLGPPAHAGPGVHVGPPAHAGSNSSSAGAGGGLAGGAGSSGSTQHDQGRATAPGRQPPEQNGAAGPDATDDEASTGEDEPGSGEPGKDSTVNGPGGSNQTPSSRRDSSAWEGTQPGRSPSLDQGPGSARPGR